MDPENNTSMHQESVKAASVEIQLGEPLGILRGLSVVDDQSSGSAKSAPSMMESSTSPHSGNGYQTSEEEGGDDEESCDSLESLDLPSIGTCQTSEGEEADEEARAPTESSNKFHEMHLKLAQRLAAKAQPAIVAAEAPPVTASDETQPATVSHAQPATVSDTHPVAAPAEAQPSIISAEAQPTITSSEAPHTIASSEAPLTVSFANVPPTIAFTDGPPTEPPSGSDSDEENARQEFYYQPPKVSRTGRLVAYGVIVLGVAVIVALLYFLFAHVLVDEPNKANKKSLSNLGAQFAPLPTNPPVFPPTLAPTVTPIAPILVNMTLEELLQHDEPEVDCWVAIRWTIYNLTTFTLSDLFADTTTPICGLDVTEISDNEVLDAVRRYRIGVVVPTVVTARPTSLPTTLPTSPPTTLPTSAATSAATVTQTVSPTLSPTVAPTNGPTVSPTLSPTVAPTSGPTILVVTATPTSAASLMQTVSNATSASNVTTTTATRTALPVIGTTPETAAPTALSVNGTTAPETIVVAAPSAPPENITTTETPTEAPTAYPTNSSEVIVSATTTTVPRTATPVASPSNSSEVPVFTVTTTTVTPTASPANGTTVPAANATPATPSPLNGTTASPAPESADVIVGQLELSLHNNADEDCWVAIHGRVYNMTTFAPNHPGGAEKIIAHCGADGTDAFTLTHTVRNLNYARAYLVGSYEP